MIGQRTAIAGREVDLSARAIQLEIQDLAMQQLAAATGFRDEPWKQMANLAAANWLAEAQNSFKLYPTWLRSTGAGRDRTAHVPIEPLIQQAPSGKWLDAVAPQLATYVRIALARLILFSEDIDRVLPQARRCERVRLCRRRTWPTRTSKVGPTA